MKRIVGVTVAAMLMAACGTSGGSGGGADSDAYPQGELTMVVTYAAGGATDIAGRSVAKAFEKELGVPVVVENVEGASGGVGSAEVVRSKPDGLTIGMTTTSAVNRVPLIEDVGFTVGDISPIGVVTQYDAVIMVAEDSPYATIDDLIDAAKDAPSEVTMGQAGAQVPGAVEIERMNAGHDVAFQNVPFQGEAPELTALLGGNVEAAAVTYNETVQKQHESGAIRPLAVMGPERTDYLPDVPTLAESGFEDLVYGTSTYILIAPKGAPESVVTRLEEVLEQAVQDKDVRTALGGDIAIPAEFIGGAELSQQMKAEADALGPILKKLYG